MAKPSNVGYVFALYESNLFNTDLHPVTGLATAGIHTRVRRLYEARNRKVEFIFNRGGSCTFSVPLDSKAAFDIVDFTLSRCVVVFVNDASGNSFPIWSGPIGDTTEDAKSNVLNISCNGWIDVIYGRELRADVSYTAQQPGAIVTGLYNLTNAIKPLPFKMGTIDSPSGPVTRTRGYKKYQKIGQAIEELSNIEGGFDYEVRLTTETITGGETIGRYLDIKYTTVKGTIKGIGQDRPNVIWGYNWGTNNLANVSRQRTIVNLKNRVTATNPLGLAGIAEDTVSQNSIGLWEDTINISDQGLSGTELAAYAGAEVTYLGRPFTTYSLSPEPYDGTIKVPRFLIDWKLGDIGYMVAKKGALQIGTSEVSGPQAVRFFGVTIEPTDEGLENITSIKTTAS